MLLFLLNFLKFSNQVLNEYGLIILFTTNNDFVCTLILLQKFANEYLDYKSKRRGHQVDIFRFDRLIIPVNLSHHSTLAVK